LTWEAIASLGEAVGGVAVIASLIYRAAQIRQSRQLERAARIREMFLKGSDMVGYTALHSEKFDTIRCGVADFSQLSREEIDLFNGWGIHCLVDGRASDVHASLRSSPGCILDGVREHWSGDHAVAGRIGLVGGLQRRARSGVRFRSQRSIRAGRKQTTFHL
jgi:hypothetical protein